LKIFTENGIDYHLPNELSEFQYQMYIHLINWKWQNITTEPGYHGKYPYDAMIPKSYKEQHYPLYPPIVERFLSHQQVYPFKSHTFIGHMASSQAACANLFLPILEDENIAAAILKVVKPDLKCIATEYFDSGFRIEFWDEPDNRLNDHNKVSGTDSDIAIAYFNEEDELNLWLIEHKLTEPEFTNCGGYKSKNKGKAHSCESIAAILNDNDLCYYHSVCQYRYWDITLQNEDVFSPESLSAYKACPFKGGMNQLWRNQLLALEIENSNSPKWPFKKVYFSVVYHPKNTSLLATLSEYEKLIQYNNRFFHFSSNKIVDAAQNVSEESIAEWREWYRELYYW
jgi:hypothetical protein